MLLSDITKMAKLSREYIHSYFHTSTFLIQVSTLCTDVELIYKFYEVVTVMELQKVTFITLTVIMMSLTEWSKIL